MPRGSMRRNVHIPWIMITFGGISLTWRGEEDRPDYFTSLTHIRKIDRANTLTVNITYCPHIGEDPNKIEKAIYNSSGICLVQYGDLASNCSRLFKALVTHYTVSFENGFLMYSFNLVSAAVCYNLAKYSHAYLDPEKGNDISTFIDVLKEAASLMEDKYNFEDPSGVLSTAKPLSTKIEFGDEKISPIKFMLKALQLITPEEEGTYYTIEIDDARRGKGRIKVVHIDPSKVSIAHRFEWGTRDGTVLSWDPKFDGGVLLQNFREQVEGGLTTISSLVNPDTGKTATVKTDGKMLSDFTTSDDKTYFSNLIRSDEDFKKAADYSYQASLTVLGEGQTVYLGNTVIQVTPLVMGKAHHSAGNYIVKGVTDNVSSSGFTTTYDLMRRLDSSEEGLYSVDKLKDNDMVWVNGTFIPYTEYKPDQ